MATRDAVGVDDLPVFDKLVIANAKMLRRSCIGLPVGRDAGVVARWIRDDRAQRNQIAFDQHADVLMHLEAKLEKARRSSEW